MLLVLLLDHVLERMHNGCTPPLVTRQTLFDDCAPDGPFPDGQPGTMIEAT